MAIQRVIPAKMASIWMRMPFGNMQKSMHQIKTFMFGDIQWALEWQLDWLLN